MLLFGFLCPAAAPGGGAADAAPAASSALPQEEQNRASSRSCLPQWVQNIGFTPLSSVWELRNINNAINSFGVENRCGCSYLSPFVDIICTHADTAVIDGADGDAVAFLAA